jgi:hypothetical protein
MPAPGHEQAHELTRTHAASLSLWDREHPMNQAPAAAPSTEPRHELVQERVLDVQHDLGLER